MFKKDIFFKKVIVLILIFITITFLYSRNIDLGVYSTLVIVEEQENGKFTNDSPFTDGIFEGLWKKSEFIFFDMSIDKPLNSIYDQLDIKPFLGVAEEAGADSILLIQFRYSAEEEGAGLRLKANEYAYNLYSLYQLKSLRSGIEKIRINDHVEKNNKDRTLKKIGMNVLNSIYKK